MATRALAVGYQYCSLSLARIGNLYYYYCYYCNDNISISTVEGNWAITTLPIPSDSCLLSSLVKVPCPLLVVLSFRERDLDFAASTGLLVLSIGRPIGR